MTALHFLAGYLRCGPDSAVEPVTSSLYWRKALPASYRRLCASKLSIRCWIYGSNQLLAVPVPVPDSDPGALLDSWAW
jgi:hypothetical protein